MNRSPARGSREKGALKLKKRLGEFKNFEIAVNNIFGGTGPHQGDPPPPPPPPDMARYFGWREKRILLKLMS